MMTANKGKRMWRLIAGIGLLMLLLAGCQAAGGETAAPTEAAPVAEATVVEATEPAAEAEAITLNVFAAASLTGAFNEIGAAFSAANPGATVVFNFAGSNQLATQISEGAPADVFASANAAQMDAAVASGRIDADGARPFVTNRLVVVVPADNPASIVELTDLARPGTVIVLAAEEVPAGQYALEFLGKASDAAGFGSTFRDDVLANVVSYEENVRSVLNKVALGEADAGIVYTSDAVSEPGVTTIAIPDALNVLAEYPIAALNDSAQADAAAAFVELVLSDEGQGILDNYGFGPSSGQ